MLGPSNALAIFYKHINDKMSDLHIDDFCKDTAKIFLQLYKIFPQKSTLYVEDICGPDEPDDFGLHSPRFQSCFSAVIWLAESDYLSYSSLIQQEAFEEIVLSHRGFTFLSSFDAEPNEENTKTITRIQQLRFVQKHGSSDKLTSVVLEYLKLSRNYQ